MVFKVDAVPIKLSDIDVYRENEQGAGLFDCVPFLIIIT